MMTIMVQGGKIIRLYEAGKKSIWEEFDSHGNRVRCQYDYDLADRILDAKFQKDMDEAIAYCLYNKL